MQGVQKRFVFKRRKSPFCNDLKFCCAWFVCTQHILGLYFRSLKFLCSSFPRLFSSFFFPRGFFLYDFYSCHRFSRNFIGSINSFLEKKRPRKPKPRTLFPVTFFLGPLLYNFQFTLYITDFKVYSTDYTAYSRVQSAR